MKISVRKITVVGVMSALSSILMLLDFPIGIVPSFIKFDFSDLPALITAFYAGPIWGGAVVLVKNLVHLPFTNTAMVGELGNFLSGCFFVIPAGLVYKYASHTKKGAIIGCVTGALSMAALSIPLNALLTFPFFMSFYGMPEEALIGAFGAIYPFVDSLMKCVVFVMAPFNILKATVLSFITVAVYKRLSNFFGK